MHFRPIIFMRKPRVAGTMSLALMLSVAATGLLPLVSVRGRPAVSPSEITPRVERAPLGASAAPRAKSDQKRQAQTDADPIVGSWFGPVIQPGAPAYNLRMSFSTATMGVTDYADIRCSGHLRGAGSHGVYTFEETIDTRRASESADGCIDGKITARIVAPDRMLWTWDGHWQGEHITASATLVRQPR